MTEYEKAVERRARAMFTKASRDWDKMPNKWVHRAREVATRQWWLDLARATLDADDAAGFALVPKEPTDEMKHEACAWNNRTSALRHAIAAGAIRREK